MINNKQKWSVSELFALTSVKDENFEKNIGVLKGLGVSEILGQAHKDYTFFLRMITTLKFLEMHWWHDQQSIEINEEEGVEIYEPTPVSQNFEGFDQRLIALAAVHLRYLEETDNTTLLTMEQSNALWDKFFLEHLTKS